MATVTLQYDGRNITIKKLLETIVSLGGIINYTKKADVKKGSLDKALEDLNSGRVYEAKDVNDMMKQILG